MNLGGMTGSGNERCTYVIRHRSGDPPACQPIAPASRSDGLARCEATWSRRRLSTERARVVDCRSRKPADAVERYPGLSIRARPPLLVRWGQGRARWYRIKQAMEAFGLLEGAAHFPFHSATVAAPLREPEVWSYGVLSDYNRATITNFAAIADRELGDFDLIDCGGHLGLFSAQFATFSRHCRRITAIEPNAGPFAYLEGNIRAGRVGDVLAINAAVSDFTGHGRLVAPAYDPLSDHALYLEPDPAGPVAVIRLDALAERAGPRLAIKLDIEGHELAVLRAAAAFLRTRERLVLCVELHRRVLDRVGQTDTGLLQAINEIRPMRWVDADHPGRTLRLDEPVWLQTGNDIQCDVIGCDA